MPRADADRDLLFGALALEKGLIAGEAMLDALRVWLDQAEGRTLGDILRERGALDATQCETLESTIADRTGGGTHDDGPSIATVADTAAASGPETMADPYATRAALDETAASGWDGVDAGGRPLGPAGDRYRVIRFHARGGLGQVSVALDRELDRQVAFKEILGQHADHPVNRARFVLEAEITGKLEHPGIVPVYGRGHHDDGRPYYAMRFIRGESLKAAIDRFHADGSLRSDPGRRSLGLRELLSRFIDACDAIAYAHSRGVLHRDIKPGNVMLGAYGETLVVDWGLAKPVDAPEVAGSGSGGDGAGNGDGSIRISASALAHGSTLDGSAIGSPPFMSPEQAAGDLDKLGPATDIFSLGAMLYTILTGRPPYSGTSIAEVLDLAIRADYPMPRSIDPTIPKAAEAICRNAMARLPADRYPTAQALADDVRRLMADEPVSALRDPWTARVARWSRRHRAAVASALALVVIAAVGLGVSSVLIARERDEARQRRREARQAVDDMYTMVAEQWLEDRLDPLQRVFLEKALAHYESFTRAEPDEPSSRLEWGRAFLRLGDVHRKLGRHGDAERAYRRSIDILATLADARADHALATSRLGSELALRTRAEDHAEADRLHRQAATIQRDLLLESASNSRRLALARTDRAWGDLLRLTGRADEAEAAYRRAIVQAELAAAASPAEIEPRQELAATLDALGVLLKDRGRPDEAEAADRRAVELYERLVAEAPNLPKPRDGLAKAYNSLALLGRDAGATPESESLLRKQVTLNGRLAEDFPDRPEYRRTLARGLTNLGILLRSTNRPRDAEPVFRRALDLNEKLAGESPEVRNFRRDQATCLNNLGELLSTTTRRQESEGFYRKALKVDEALMAEAPELPEPRAAAAGVWNNLGVWLKASGRLDEAMAAFDQASKRFEALAIADPNRPDYRRDGSKCLSNLGNLLWAAGRHPEAEDAFRRAVGCFDAIAARLSVSPPDRLGLAIALSNRGGNQSAGKLAGADESLRRSIAAFEGLAAGPNPTPIVRRGLAAARANLGDWLASVDRQAEAESAYLGAIGLLDALVAEAPASIDLKSDRGQALGNFAELRIAQGRRVEARGLLDRALVDGMAVLAASPNNAAMRRALRDQAATLADLRLDGGAHADAARAAELSLKTADDPAKSRAAVARLMARCVASALADSALGPARRSAVAGAYADRSIALIREAIEAGDPGADRLLDDAAFAPVRDRDGFKALRLASAGAGD